MAITLKQLFSVASAANIPVKFMAWIKSDGTQVVANEDTPLPVSGFGDPALVGAVNETAPATDTASSGLNGRLQRIAQRLTTLISTQAPTITEVRSNALETGHVLKNAAGSLKQLTIFNSKGSAQFALLMNSTTVPGDGAVTLLLPPIPLAAGSIVVIDFPVPLVASTGIAISNSSTGTFTKTIGSADCAFYAQVI